MQCTHARIYTSTQTLAQHTHTCTYTSTRIWRSRWIWQVQPACLHVLQCHGSCIHLNSCYLSVTARSCAMSLLPCPPAMPLGDVASDCCQHRIDVEEPHPSRFAGDACSMWRELKHNVDSKMIWVRCFCVTQLLGVQQTLVGYNNETMIDPLLCICTPSSVCVLCVVPFVCMRCAVLVCVWI